MIEGCHMQTQNLRPVSDYLKPFKMLEEEQEKRKCKFGTSLCSKKAEVKKFLISEQALKRKLG